MSGIDLEIRVEDAKLIAGLLRAVGAQKQFTTEVDKTKKKSQEADAELNRFVNSIKKIDAKPTEVYRQQMDLLNKALKEGKIQQDQFERTAQRLLQTQQAADPFFQQQIRTEQQRKRAAEETAAALEAEAAAAKKVADALAQQEQRRANAIVEQDRTAIEKYKLAIAELNTLREKGRLTQDQFNRAVERETAAYQAADPWLKKHAAGIKANEAAQREMARAQAAALANSRSSAMEMAAAFGVITTAAGAAQMAVHLVSSAWNEANEKIREAKQLLSDMEDPLIELNQVSASTDQFKQRTSRIEAAAAKEGVPVKEAAKVFLDAVGADAEGDFETILASRRGVMKPSDAGTVVSKMTGLFKGQVGAKEAIDLVLAASASEGTKDTVTNIVQGIPKAALGGSQLGASPAATLATLTSLSDAMGGNATMAGDRLQAFGIKMKLAGHQGNFVDVMQKIRAMPEDQRAELLGNDQEINVAYELLNKNEALIRSRTAEAEKASADSRAGRGMGQQKIEQWQANADTAAIQKAAEAKVARDVALKQTQGVRGAQQDAVLNELDTRMMRAGATPYQQAWTNRLGKFYSGIGVPNRFLPYLTGVTGQEAAAGKPDAAAAQLEAAKLQKEAAQAQKAATQNNKHRALNAEALQPVN